MLWLPAPSVEIEQAAVLPLSVMPEHVPIAVPPSLNVTVPTPLGLPPVAVTVAVNVTESPYVLGFAPLVRETVVVVARVLVVKWAYASEALPPLPDLPEMHGVGEPPITVPESVLLVPPVPLG